MATIFTKPVVVNAPEKDVVFDGCDFTAEALMQISAAKSLTIKNCRFYALTPNKSKSYGIIMDKAAKAKLIIENCFFGDNAGNEKGKLYNLMELTGSLMDGSSISKNYFTKGCCTHNQINIYQADQDAVINVNNNVAMYSANMCRIGLMGESKCVINMVGNAYYETDPSDGYDYAGLVLIQPYGKQTTSFNGMRLNVDKTKNGTSSDQIMYLYAGSADTPFNRKTNYPVVYVDGELVVDVPLAGGTVVVDPDEKTEAPADNSKKDEAAEDTASK